MPDEPNTTTTATQAATDEMKRLFARAQKGDLAVLPQLREVLDANPKIWEHLGNLNSQAEAALIKLVAGKDLLFGESMFRKQGSVVNELAGPDASPLERALAERAALASLHAAYFDSVVAQSKGIDFARLNAVRKHQDSSHKRFLDAIKMLATVRKLVQPARSPLEMLTPVEERPEPAAVTRARGRASKPELQIVN
jgi:hypothetical protein